MKGYKDKYIPYKVGGLGKRLEPGRYQTWVCLLDNHPCGDPHYCWGLPRERQGVHAVGHEHGTGTALELAARANRRSQRVRQRKSVGSQ